MKVLHVGDLVGLPFNLVRVLRENKVDASLYVPQGYSPLGVDWDHGGKPDWVLEWRGGALSLPTRLAKMREFDVIQPCAMGVTYAWLSGKPTTPYTMGSDLRKVAFEPGLRGWAMRTGFKKADAVFFSNPDQLSALRQMDLNGVFIPQALPTIKPRKGKPGEKFTVFCASRLDWSTPSSKGIDRLIRAFALLPKKVCQKSRLVLVDWGADNENAKRLAASLGLCNVEFAPLMKKSELLAKYAYADLVVDQFVTKSIGLAAFEAMLCGVPVLAGIDKGKFKACYGEKTPIINAGTPLEIADALEQGFGNRGELRKLGSRSRAWVLKHHDGRKIAAIAKKAYAKALEC